MTTTELISTHEDEETNANYIYPNPTTQAKVTPTSVAKPTPIQSFYSGTNVFITGATGFLGKILLEKLLRSCPGIQSVYLLVRQKKGKNMTQRVDELFDDDIFERLKGEQPKFRHKVVGVAGDCSLPELGLGMQDKMTLQNQIHVVFHVAATVRFDEKLKLAVSINIKGPREILKLCKAMPNLKSVVHVSTTYANCHVDLIDEKIYQPAMDYNKLIAITDAGSDKMIEAVTPTILDKWPNTYTFTKQVAEDLLRTEAENLPIGIFRPAIVVSTFREPIKGWINNLYGPTGVCAGAGSGVLRTLHCDSEAIANIVPVDMCVNSLIAVAWEVGTDRNLKNGNKQSDIPVYNYESCSQNPIKWGRFMYLCHLYGIEYPTSKAIWYYCFSLHKNLFVHMLCVLFLHYIPAAIFDFGLIVMRKQPRMINIYKKIHKFTAVISYFSTRNWTFKNTRVQKLCERMSPEDKDIFFSDIKSMDWNEFFKEYLKGIRVYLLNDPLSTHDEARVRFRRLYWLHQITKLVLICICLRIIWSIVSYVLL